MISVKRNLAWITPIWLFIGASFSQQDSTALGNYGRTPTWLCGYTYNIIVIMNRMGWEPVGFKNKVGVVFYDVLDTSLVGKASPIDTESRWPTNAMAQNHTWSGVVRSWVTANRHLPPKVQFLDVHISFIELPVIQLHLLSQSRFLALFSEVRNVKLPSRSTL